MTSTAVRAAARGAKLRVSLNTGQVVEVPFDDFPRLRDATAAQRGAVRITRGGLAFRWEEIDEDLSLEGLLRDYPVETPAAQSSPTPTSRTGTKGVRGRTAVYHSNYRKKRSLAKKAAAKARDKKVGKDKNR
ncbi:MAG: DUF2442 domain-containing protein [Bacteroidota bacterium]